MPFIHLTTFIAAPVEAVFDISRNVNAHRNSMRGYGEEAVAGKRDGLMEKGDTVTWKAKHLGKKRFLKVAITELRRPQSFVDEMLEGDFKSMRHEHHFKPIENGTLMIDQFRFETPYGLAGRILNRFFLTNYMTALLEERNRHIKEVVERARI